MRAFIAISLVLILAGCQLLPTRTVYERYPVPIYTVPEPPTIERPDLPIYTLTVMDAENTEKVIQSYIVSVRLLLNYAEANTQVVEAYRDLANKLGDPQVFSRSMVEPNAKPPSKLEVNGLLQSSSIQSQEVTNRFDEIVESYNAKNAEILEEFGL